MKFSALTTGAKFLAGIRSEPTFLGVGLLEPLGGWAFAGATAPKATPAAPVVVGGVTACSQGQVEDGQLIGNLRRDGAWHRTHRPRSAYGPQASVPLTSESDVAAGHLGGHAQTHLSKECYATSEGSRPLQPAALLRIGVEATLPHELTQMRQPRRRRG